MTETTRPSDPDLPDLTIAEAAKKLRCCEKTVRNLIEREDLEAIRYGTRFVRIPRAAPR